MGPQDTAALVNEVGAEPIGNLVVAMGPELAAAVVHEMGVDLTADLVAELGVGTASGIVHTAGASDTGALVRAMGAEFTAALVTKMGVAQNVSLVAALGPTTLAGLVAAMGPAFIASLSVSMTGDIFSAIFGGASYAGDSGSDKADTDRPRSPAEAYIPVGGSSSSTVHSSIISGLQEGVRTTPVTPGQRVVIPTVTLTNSSTGERRLLPHLVDGTRLPVAASNSSSSSSRPASSSNLQAVPLQGTVGGGDAAAAAYASEPVSYPISTASTTVSVPSIDSTYGIPAVVAPAAAASVAPAYNGQRVVGTTQSRTNSKKIVMRELPLTPEAERVIREDERQGGWMQ
jgi:hypothetical protein